MAPLNPGRRGGERGQAIVELALTLPLLLLVVLGVFDFGLMFERYEVVVNAAREGARVGVLPDYSSGDAEEHAKNYLLAGGVPASAPAAGACPATGGEAADRICIRVLPDFVTLPTGRTVRVFVSTVSYDHEHIFVGPIGRLFGGTVGITRLRAVSVMRREATD